MRLFEPVKGFDLCLGGEKIGAHARLDRARIVGGGRHQRRDVVLRDMRAHEGAFELRVHALLGREAVRIGNIAPAVVMHRDMHRLARVADEMRPEAEIADRQLFARFPQSRSNHARRAAFAANFAAATSARQ